MHPILENNVKSAVLIAIGIVLGIIFSTCIFYMIRQQYNDKLNSFDVTNEFSGLPRKLTVDAALGNERASLLILEKLDNECARFYNDREKLLRCNDEMRIWAWIDAENGGNIGSTIISGATDNDTNCLNNSRALYWERRLKSIGRGDSENEKKLLGRIQNCLK